MFLLRQIFELGVVRRMGELRSGQMGVFQVLAKRETSTQVHCSWPSSLADPQGNERTVYTGPRNTDDQQEIVGPRAQAA